MILIVIITIIVFVFVYRTNIHKVKGTIGESNVARTLRRLPKDEYKLFNNLLLHTSRGSSQIDHVVISVYGIFVIETKRYSGWIHGNEKSQNWTQTIYKKRTKFRNPIKQNWSHIYALKEVLSDYGGINYYNIVVFTGDGKLKNVTFSTPVIYRRQLNRTIIAHSESQSLDIARVNAITAKLRDVAIRNRRAKKRHVVQTKKNIREAKKKKRRLICPRCDSDLVVRKGQYGKFYGCSNYPKCRFTMPY